MKIEFNISELVEIISEDVSRLAARSYSEDGTSLYDGIKLTSRDTSVLERKLEERDARLRDILAFCLGDSEDGDYCPFVYNLLLNGAKNSTLTSLRVLMRKYLTEGVLFDWYTKHGIATSLTEEGIEAMESKIVCMVRQGYIKKPLQPFGPRN